MSFSLFQKKLDKEVDEREKYENFCSAEDGYLLNVRFEEQVLQKEQIPRSHSY